MHFSTVIEIYTVVHPWRKASVIVKPWQSEPVVAFRQTLWTSRKERETLGSRTNLTDLDACELRWFSGGSLNPVTNPKSLLSYPLCTLRKYSTIMSCSDQLQTPVYNLAPLLWPMPISHAIMPWWSFLGASQPHGRKVSNTSPAFALQGVLPRLVEMQSMHMPGGMMLVRVSRMLRKDFLHSLDLCYRLLTFPLIAEGWQVVQRVDKEAFKCLKAKIVSWTSELWPNV